MTLFKVRDFWTFDLDALQLQSNDTNADGTSPLSEDYCTEGNFTASVGRFHSIGNQDVFVCGDLRGFIYVVQVPNADQRRYTKAASQDFDSGTAAAAAATVTTNPGSSSGRIQSNQDEASTSSSTSTIDTEERQLLAATNLHAPIVDIKCGYFTSAIKQTIAVLSFDKLIIFQVKRRLIFDPTDTESSASDKYQSTTIDESLLSHGLEEYVSLDLLNSEFAHNILVLNSHAESNLVSYNHQIGTRDDTNSDPSVSVAADNLKHRSGDDNKFLKRSKQVAQQLHLPQRDKIIVQYANQFVFTLIDSKKITGHFSMFSLVTSDNQTGGNNEESTDSNLNAVKMQQMSCYVGSTPMAHLYGTNNKTSSSLIISFSDHQIYCVPLNKLIDLTKQDIMKRVAHNLLHYKTGKSPQLAETLIESEKPSSLTYMAKDNLLGAKNRTISIDIEALSEWTYELIAMPLQMQSIQRQAKSAVSVGHRDDLTISQLLIMSRFSLDLFTSCGQHLWSQRFETPLVCFFAYTIDLSDVTSDLNHNNNNNEQQILADDSKQNQIQTRDQLISLLCTDSLSSGKSNLNILKEGQIIWSALLNAKPFRIWRLNLAQMPGVVSLLDIAHSQLIASYLGTNNLDSTGDVDISNDQVLNDNMEASDVSKLELLDEPLFKDDKKWLASDTEATSDIQPNKKLIFEVSLEASDKWPQVSVDIWAKIQLESSATKVIHNIIATLEYDDLLKFDMSPTDNQLHTVPTISYPSAGVARVYLGNCWPDRREPISFRGIFNLLSTSKNSFGTSAMNDMETSNYQLINTDIDIRLVPKSLKVSVFLNYNEIHSGLMIQEESFLLPINMISQLTHIDYSSGSGQDLSDYLGNLPGHYKRVKEYKKETSHTDQPYHYCDLFLKLDHCDLVSLLEEFVESDLVCRGMNFGARKQQQRTDSDKMMETLENINLLAQSLDCRLRYKNPAGAARQSSEELCPPVIATFALSFNDLYATLSRDYSTKSGKRSDYEQADDVTVWIHICDMTANDSTIPEELVTQHMKDWMRYSSKLSEDTSISGESVYGSRKNLIISIECSRSLPVVLVLSHMLDRVKILTAIDSLLDSRIITTNEFSTFRNFRHFLESGPRLNLAINSDLHNSLTEISNSYEINHKNNFKRLRDTLEQESCKFQIVTMTTLSLSKRLPGLPSDISKQLTILSALIRQCQHNLIGILKEMESLKKSDYEFSKVPHVPIIKLASTSGREPLRDCPNFECIID